MVPQFLTAAIFTAMVLAQQLPPSDRADQERNILAMMKKAGVPGLSIGVLRGGKLEWSAGLGVRSAKSKVPVTRATAFHVGSLSKPVFAYGVMKLVDAGKLKLDEPIASYVPREFTQAIRGLRRLRLALC